MSREALKIVLPSVLVVLIGFFVAYRFVDPAPPHHIRMAAGPSTGAYAAYAERYRHLLGLANVDLEIMPTAGSVENLALLEAGVVDLAFVQGGIEPPSRGNVALALGSVFLEPFWLFMPRTVDEVARPLRLAELAGKRIAIGPPGSGTNALARRLLGANGIDDEHASLLDMSLDDAADGLVAGHIDAGIVVASERASIVQRLLTASGLAPVSLDRAPAYAQRYRFLQTIRLEAGAFDLARDLPAQPTDMVAAAAALVAHEDLHPALVDLLMIMVSQVHKAGGIFEHPGAFPSFEHVEFPLHEDAKRYYDNGPRFLLRYLPFWAATFVDRMAVMLIPLVTLLLPLARILPPAIDWRVRSRVYRWYDDLRAVEAEAMRAQEGGQAKDLLERLNALERQVSDISVPLARTDLVYTLRLHINLIRERLLQRQRLDLPLRPEGRRSRLLD